MQFKDFTYEIEIQTDHLRDDSSSYVVHTLLHECHHALTRKEIELYENKKLDELMKLSNEYFDVRRNDYLNAAKEKREALNDSQFIEYLYNRAYAMLYLLRLKHKGIDEN